MTQESENKLARRVDDKRADVPLQWSEPAQTNAVANTAPSQRELPEFTGLDALARAFAEAANGAGKVVLSAQSCDLLYRAMTTPIVAPVAPAVQAQAELTDEDIDVIWQTMPGGPAGWLKSFGYRQFARAVEEWIVENGLSRSAAREQARNEAQWISVDDRLPEDGAVVAIIDPANFDYPVRTAQWLAGTCTFESELGWLAKEEVSHWTPLPEAPAASKEGNAK